MKKNVKERAVTGRVVFVVPDHLHICLQLLFPDEKNTEQGKTTKRSNLNRK